MKTVSLLLALHNHQPVGNFDSVFEECYERSYLPVLETWRDFHDIPFSIHNSGVLWDWIAEHRPYYMELARILSMSGQMELLTGGYYEPILAAIPDEDKIGQVRKLTGFLHDRFRTTPETLWLTERVWEPALPAPLAAAGVKAVLVDDEHFHAAGVAHSELAGHFMTEEAGASVAVFPILKELRYLIPFRPPGETIEFLRGWASEGGDRLAVLGDDGEKFGVWPDTYKTVFEEGWLRRFLELLRENREWLHVTTPSRWMREKPSRGLVYLPTASYAEMGEWALPTRAQQAFVDVRHREEHDPAGSPFVRGGFWRNFLSKYPESNRMHKRALDLSRRIREVPEPQQREPLDALWQAQCNCAYWHGVFGGLYLPHLRDAVHRRLLRAETLLMEARGLEMGARELDLFGDEGRAWMLFNPHLSLGISPRQGGMLFEWGDRRTGHDFGNTLGRRAEGYHSRLEHAGEAGAGGEHAGSIHDRVKTKEHGLEKLLAEDPLPRASFLDHVFPPGVTGPAARLHLATGPFDFAGRPYEADLEWDRDRVILELKRDAGPAAWAGARVRITKVYTLLRDYHAFEVIYRVQHLSGPAVDAGFGVEWNVTFLTASAMDRWMDFGGRGGRVGMGHDGAFESVEGFKLGDEWLDLAFEVEVEPAASVWTWPVETVSLSEDGFERNYQGTCILHHWPLVLEEGGMREFRFEVGSVPLGVRPSAS